MGGLEMKYFVLKPRVDDAYARASRAAINSYATLIEETNKELADGLKEWAAREGAEAYARSTKEVESAP